jgi:hypothetical protein
MSQTTRPTCDRAHQLTNSMQRKLGENRVSRILRVQPGLFSSFSGLGISPSYATSHSAISTSRLARLLLNTRQFGTHHTYNLAGLQHATKRTPNYMQNSKLDMQIQNIKITANTRSLLLCNTCGPRPRPAPARIARVRPAVLRPAAPPASSAPESCFLLRVFCNRGLPGFARVQPRPPVRTSRKLP